MAITQFIIIYLLAVNDGTFGLNGETVRSPATNGPANITTDSPFVSKSVIKNSSLTANATFDKQTNIIVAPEKQMPNASVSVASSLNDETDTAATVANNVMKTSSDNFNNKKSTKLAVVPTSANNGPFANGTANNAEKSAKNAATVEIISKSDSSNSTTKTPNLVATRAVVMVASTETDNDTRVQTKQLETLPPINEEKILLTGNSHNEQLNNGLGWNEPLTHNGNDDDDDDDAPRSVSNSIITTTTTQLHARNEDVSIANSTKMTEMRSKTIEPFTSFKRNAHQKSDQNYITRATGNGPPHETSSPTLLTTLLSTTDKHNRTETQTEFDTKTETQTESLSRNSHHDLATANSEMKLMNLSINGEHSHLSNPKNVNTPEHFHGNLKSFANSNANAPKWMTDNSSSVSTSPSNFKASSFSVENIHRVHNNKSSNTNSTKFNGKTIDLNHSTVDTLAILQSQRKTTAKTVTEMELVTTKAISMTSMPAAANENYFNMTKENILKIKRKKPRPDANLLIKADEIQDDSVAVFDDDERDGWMTKTTLVNKRTTNDTVVAKAKYDDIAKYSLNKIHANNANEMQMQMKVADNQALNQKHNESVVNDVKTAKAQISLKNYNGLANCSSIDANRSMSMTKGRANQGPADILSQPLEIINSSTSSKLMMPSVFVDEVNNGRHISASEPTPTPLNVATTSAHNKSTDIEKQFIRSQYGTKNNLSAIMSAENPERNIEKDLHHFDVALMINRADGDFNPFANGQNDNTSRAMGTYVSNAYLSFNDASLEGNNVNNFFSAAITDHETGNQLAIDDTNDTIYGTNDRYAFLFQILTLFSEFIKHQLISKRTFFHVLHNFRWLIFFIPFEICSDMKNQVLPHC